MTERPTITYTTRALDPSTWDLFAELVDRNNGVFGGCWCIGYHAERFPGLGNRAAKHELVRTGGAHAALVVDEDGRAQGWAQYGDPDELAGIKHGREYRKDAPPQPDWRITCVFVDKSHRGLGVARAAVGGALELIGQAGGGLVEAITEVTDGRTAQPRFLFSATAELFEQYDFTRVRQVGKHAWILSRQLPAAPPPGPAPPPGSAPPAPPSAAPPRRPPR
jgi:GNAT superfamily N-acetyltransferase